MATGSNIKDSFLCSYNSIRSDVYFWEETNSVKQIASSLEVKLDARSLCQRAGKGTDGKQG